MKNSSHPTVIEINLRTLLQLFYKSKVLIIAITLLFAVSSVFIALSISNVYRSEALVNVIDQNGNSALAGLSSQFGGLASLAGVNLKGGGDGKKELTIETLKSRDFIKRFINKYDLKAVILASEDWDQTKNQIVFDADLYNLKEQKWIRKVAFPKTVIPSDIEVYRHFLEKNLFISEDDESGFVRVAVHHFSPYVAQKIVTNLIFEINQEIREKDILEAEKSIAFLEEKLQTTDNLGLKKVMFEMVESQIQSQMLAEIREEYIFQVIDPPIVDELKVSPKRAMICVVITLLGMFSSMLFVLFHFIYRKQGR